MIAKYEGGCTLVLHGFDTQEVVDAVDEARGRGWDLIGPLQPVLDLAEMEWAYSATMTRSEPVEVAIDSTQRIDKRVTDHDSASAATYVPLDWAWIQSELKRRGVSLSEELRIMP